MARKKNRRELPDLRSIQISPAYYAGKCVGNLLRWLFLLAIAFIILYPLLYMVSMAFRSPKDFMDITVVWLPKTPTWDNFRTAVVDVHLLEAMKNTVLIAVGSWPAMASPGFISRDPPCCSSWWCSPSWCRPNCWGCPTTC